MICMMLKYIYTNFSIENKSTFFEAYSSSFQISIYLYKLFSPPSKMVNAYSIQQFFLLKRIISSLISQIKFGSYRSLVN
jgi:hypothetical protein